MHANQSKFSRRDFLKLSALGALSLLVPPARRAAAAWEGLQGRVLLENAMTFDRPSVDGWPVAVFWKDNLLNIVRAVVGTDEDIPNRTWYELEDGSYIHATNVQSVRTVMNEPQKVPEWGVLSEVTIPFTDAHTRADHDSEVAYRFYYGTTHWIDKRVYGRGLEPWYRVIDDRLDKTYFVPARYLRVIPATELQPLSPDVPPENKRIEVSISKQQITAYEGRRAVFMAQASTGDTDFYTPTGIFDTYYKRPSRHMDASDLTGGGDDLPGVPWVSYFHKDGIAFHGAYWHNDFGNPRSHGCVNLSIHAAKWIYLWTNPVVRPDYQLIHRLPGSGTKVEIKY